MKLSELNKRIKNDIKVGDIIKWRLTEENRYFYTRVVAIDGKKLAGYWYSRKGDCNPINDTEIGGWREIERCELV
jgi:hypothetical protein